MYTLRGRAICPPEQTRPRPRTPPPLLHRSCFLGLLVLVLGECFPFRANCRVQVHTVVFSAAEHCDAHARQGNTHTLHAHCLVMGLGKGEVELAGSLEAHWGAVHKGDGDGRRRTFEVRAPANTSL